MNDPDIDAVRRNSERANADGDTCRICRGDGSQEEPLFYPCKCSGSIKYVHQACLMEWLSHSQKKHCELCKTPFRFTKLYDPHMPTSVPFGIFFKQASLHIVRGLMTWARWNLVIFVWLCWVPWCMRAIWRFFFWIGDGAWLTRSEIERHARRITKLAATLDHSRNIQNSTSLLSNVTATTSAAIANILPKWGPISQTLNSTSREPTSLWIFRRMISGFIFPYTAIAPSPSISLNGTVSGRSPRSSSVLSDVVFLKRLTRWETLNNVFIDILEGQLITLSIVTAFILVFLIREWVVQQQPMVNLNVGQNAAGALEGPVRIENDAGALDQVQDEQAIDDPINPPAGEQQDFKGSESNESDSAADHMRNFDETSNTQGLFIGSPSQDRASSTNRVNDHQLKRMPATDFSLGRTNDVENSAQNVAHDAGEESLNPHSDDSTSNSGLTRPRLPAKDAAAQATDIQRTLEEESSSSGKSWPGVDVFMDLWNRGNEDPEQILKLIEQEGKGEELSWIVSAMQRMKQSNTSKSSDENGDDSHVDADKEADDDVDPAQETSKRSSDSWQVVEGQDGNDNADALHDTEAEKHTTNAHGTSSTLEANETQHLDEDLIRDVFSEPDHSADSTEIPNVASGASSETQNHEDRAASETRDTSTAIADDKRSLHAKVGDWLWGGVPQPNAPGEDQDRDEEHIVEDLAQEAPFIPVADGQPVVDNGAQIDANDGDVPAADPEVIRAAAEAGIDPNDVEAIEEGDDLEGVMELIGVQGPLHGLFQNGMFSIVLISMTVLIGIWLPYIFGKLVLVFMANPTALLIKMPLRWTSTTADIIVDLCIVVAGYAFYAVDMVVRLIASPLGWVLPIVQTAHQNRSIRLFAFRAAGSAGERFLKNVAVTGEHFSDLDIPIFSIVAHESLLKLENSVINTVSSIFLGVRHLLESPISITRFIVTSQQGVRVLLSLIAELPRLASGIGAAAQHVLSALSSFDFFRIDLEIPMRQEPLDYGLSYWSTRDRMLTVIVGYVFFSVAGAIYLKLRRFVKEFHQEGELPDGMVVDVLNQAAGVLKVILIITIEMIAFPLYCGMLLDIALLPLFENATLVSRILFTANSPSTSLFIHWFVGTCYMFHFALFVSMCRRIMRSGVLYFIRDPDDPSFHPVRDVLERSVSTQLRKILFSALVYGGLVIICLGAVVWGLSAAISNVFPIHWSPNEPVLPYPADLLVYNFLMPGTFRIFKPSTSLQNMYKWWFRRCARALRLTQFLFDERREDEEGHYVRMASEGPAFSEVSQSPASSKPKKEKVLVRDSRLVRAPASDQVRIPKGSKTFVEIDEDGNRIDGLPDNHQGLHGRDNKMFSSIYIPPHFRLRIAAFIVLLWVFAAVTGVSLTILPLAFGRYVFSRLIPRGTNDIYAFIIGLYLLGGPVYLAMFRRNEIGARLKLPGSLNFTIGFIKQVLYGAGQHGIRLIRLLYFYGAFSLLLPSLVALVAEAYLLVPVHTYLTRNSGLPVSHTVHFIADWIIGVLCVRVGISVLLRFRETRPSQALRALVSPSNNDASWLDPDIRLATRAFIFPIIALLTLGLVLPLGLGFLLNLTWFSQVDAGAQTVVYRYAYPAVLFIILTYVFGRMLQRAIGKWRAKVRDEVYLIGERLHNFGEKRARTNRVGTRN